jgi:GT2 family glycosyltransferase
MKKPTLSIIVVSFNTQKLLSGCLKSVFRSTKGLDFEVIVVDNHSQDGSAEMVKKEFPGVKLIANSQNTGFSRANNQGLRQAKGSFLLLLNSDTIVHKDALVKMVAFLKSKKEAGVVGPRLLNQDGSYQPSAGRFPTLGVSAIMLFKEHFRADDRVRGSFAKTRPVDWVMGAALMVKKEALNQAGLLDEAIFMYLEEVELCYRIKSKGWKIFFYPQAKITHLGQGSSLSGRQGPILNIYKGLTYFYQKHRSLPERLVLKLMLKTKAALAYLIGVLTQNQYLKETYGQALKIN